MILQLFFERLRAERISRGFNQDEMAEKVGVSKRSYCAYEAGETAPSAKLLAALAGMGVDVNYVLTGERSQEYIRTKLSQAGGRIRKVRGARTVAEFAEQIGTTPEVVSKVEAGEEWISNELLGRIIEREKLSPMWLLSGDELELDGEMTHMEKVLIANYRAASAEGKKALEVQAAFFATNNVTAKIPAPATHAKVKVKKALGS